MDLHRSDAKLTPPNKNNRPIKNTMAQYAMPTKGFTMIELIMVIVIIGILATSARALLSTEAFEQRFFADETLQALRFAQQSAITQGCAVQFQIIDGTGFDLRQDKDCGVDDTPDFTTLPLVYLKRPSTNDDFINNDWPNGVTLADTDGTDPVGDASTGQSTVVFYPQGWACAADGSNNNEFDYDFTSTFTISLNLVCATGFIYEG